MWKSCARVWPRSRRCAGFPSWESCRILRSTWTTRTRSRRAYLPARRAASSTSPSWRLPPLSNFTDFDPLSRVPGMGVRYVSSTTDLGRPDLVVLPGSKSTVDDARWLAASGIGACVRALSGAGTPVLGICGGYQLLGDELSDPHGREGAGTARGLGLIPASTVFKEEKRLAQSELRITGRPRRVLGVERHDGARVRDSRRRNDRLLRPCGARLAANQKARPAETCSEPISTACSTNRGWHSPSRARSRACAACPRASWVLRARCPRPIHRAREFDRLADSVRGALDMEYVYRIIEEGV